MISIITADERLTNRSGIKILILGVTGIGKTSLLRTIDPAEALFVDIDRGGLAVQDLEVDTVQVDDWPTARDLACRVGGPHPSYSPTQCYSEAHYRAVGGTLANLDRYKIIFIDGITAVSRYSFRWAEQQPEAFSRTGAKDTRAAYGLHAREMLAWLYQLQFARSKHIVLTGILERTIDDLNRFVGYQVQMEGAKVPREIGAVMDELLVMEQLDFGDGKPPTRGFVCTSPNPWQYCAKDRSGRLAQIEPPHLGKLIAKITNPVTVSPVKADAAE
jgi:AAA domain